VKNPPHYDLCLVTKKTDEGFQTIMNQKEKSSLKKILHTHFHEALRGIDVDLKGKPYADVVTDYLAEEIDSAVDVAVDEASEVEE